MRTIALLSVAALLGIIVAPVATAVGASSGSGSGSGLGSGSGDGKHKCYSTWINISPVCLSNVLHGVIKVDINACKAVICGLGTVDHVLVFILLAACGNAACSQDCMLTPGGGFRCVCNPGYVLDEDGYTCSGKTYYY